MAAAFIFRSALVAGVSPPLRAVALGSKASATPWDAARDSGPLGSRVDALFMSRFRSKLAAELGRDSGLLEHDYSAVIELVSALHARDAASPVAVAASSRHVLRSLFPNWPPFNPPGTVGLLHWFGVLFARPFPVFSARLNTWVTWLAAQWLMGPCEIGDIDEADDLARLAAGSGEGQLLLVKRCRYLEESGCASICVNTCKMPTQDFFGEDMGVPITIAPDYETLECRFKFGVPPSAEDEAEARAVACFSGCPQQQGQPAALTGSSLRSGGRAASASASLPPTPSTSTPAGRCVRMGDCELASKS